MENNKEAKSVIFARVSSKEQEETGYSLEAQENLLKDYAKDKGLKVEKIYKVTESASGKQVRKMFIEMIQYINKNNINIILCEKIDRLTRNLKDAAIANDWITEKDGREIHFVKENFIVNKNTKAHENLVWDMKVAMARFYTNNLSEEVKKGQKQKIVSGWYPSKPPIGYKTIGEKGHKIHVIDDKVSPYIIQMFTLYATGNYSTPSLGEKLYQLGFRSRSGYKVSKSRIYDLLSDPFFYGKFLWNDKIYQGKQEPIITKDLFDQVQDKLTRYNHTYQNKHFLEFKNKVFCGSCNKTITWERQKGNLYGACKQCKAQLAKDRKYIRQEILEDLLLPRMTSVAPKNEQILNVLNKALKESHSEEIKLYEAQEEGINNSLKRIRQRKSNLYEDRLDERITIQEYDQKVGIFIQEEESLVEALRKLKSNNTEYYKVGIAIHNLALNAKDIYLSEKATVEERRLLLSYVFSNITILQGRTTVEYTKGFEFMAKWMPLVNDALEPVNCGSNKGKESTFVLSKPAMLRR